jgi:SAM-dependent methyltransferase
MKSVLRFIRDEWRVLRDPASPPRSKEQRFGIRSGYRHRINNAPYDDTPNGGEHQLEVYLRAADEAKRLSASRIIDVGCGSGHKLVKYLSEFETVGLEVEPTLTWLTEKYPNRVWKRSDFDGVAESGDVIICADVIEHIPDPDKLLRYLARMECKILLISTPERNRVYAYDHRGPPRNPAHCREWAFDEFARYIGEYFTIIDHVISNEAQATQLVVAMPRKQ